MKGAIHGDLTQVDVPGFETLWGPLMMELLDKIRAFVALQTALVAALKDALGELDWKLLLDVPKSGVVSIGADEWGYQRHGVGVRFEREGVVVDANRHLDQDPGLFDVGRLVEFLESEGSTIVLSSGNVTTFDFGSGSALLEELEASGQISRVKGLSGELFRLNG